MTPQEKANELVEKFKEHSQLMLGYGGFSSRHGSAKQCALIAVEECLKAVESDWSFMQKRIEYWQQVKQEIENL